MNSKITLTFLLGLLLIGLAGVRLSSTAATHSNVTSASQADDAVELVWSFEVRIRLPLTNKEAL